MTYITTQMVGNISIKHFLSFSFSIVFNITDYVHTDLC